MPNSLVAWTVDGVFAGTGNQINVTGLSLGSHIAEVTATDGNLSTKVSRQFDVLVDLGNPTPNVTINSPGSHLASDTIEELVGPPYEYVFTATATATDVAPNPVNPTITWYWRVSGTATEHLIGTGTIREIRLPTDGVPCAGVAWDVIARHRREHHRVRFHPGDVLPPLLSHHLQAQPERESVAAPRCLRPTGARASRSSSADRSGGLPALGEAALVQVEPREPERACTARQRRGARSGPAPRK